MSECFRFQQIEPSGQIHFGYFLLRTNRFDSWNDRSFSSNVAAIVSFQPSSQQSIFVFEPFICMYIHKTITYSVSFSSFDSILSYVGKLNKEQLFKLRWIKIHQQIKKKPGKDPAETGKLPTTSKVSYNARRCRQRSLWWRGTPFLLVIW